MYRFLYMIAMTYTSARQNLAETMDRVCEDCAPVTITRSGSQQAVVMVSLQEYQQLEETAHLLRSPANARHISFGEANHSMELMSRGEFDDVMAPSGTLSTVAVR